MERVTRIRAIILLLLFSLVLMLYAGRLIFAAGLHYFSAYRHLIRPPYGQVDSKVVFFNISFNYCNIAFYNCIMPHLIGEIILGIGIFCYDNDTRSIHVYTVGKPDLE